LDREYGTIDEHSVLGQGLDPATHGQPWAVVSRHGRELARRSKLLRHVGLWMLDRSVGLRALLLHQAAINAVSAQLYAHWVLHVASAPDAPPEMDAGWRDHAGSTRARDIGRQRHVREPTVARCVGRHSVD
jgi:hypothetical protein